jgi:hypothetical protein
MKYWLGHFTQGFRIVARAATRGRRMIPGSNSRRAADLPLSDGGYEPD